jgi:uncharacterized protein (TIGR03435 family)
MPGSTVRAGFLVLAVCLAYSQTVEKPPGFDVASIKPHSDTAESGSTSRGGVIISKGGGGGAPFRGGSLSFRQGTAASGRRGVTARRVILEAYRLTTYQLSGGPGWLDTDVFDLEAKAETAAGNQLRQMLQTLLAERFQLVVRRETKEMPVYALMMGKNGTKLPGWKQGDPVPMPVNRYPKNLRFAGTMQDLADDLSGSDLVGRPVLDKTGLTGAYVLSFGWEADEDYIRALQEQLGLKLESQKAALDAVVIERIQKPSPN